MIINALKSSMVDLPRLAKTIEDHIPNPTATSVHASKPLSGNLEPVDQSCAATTKSEQAADSQRQPGSPEPSSMTPTYVKAKIKQFEKRFNKLKRSIRDSLKQSKIPIERIADVLSDMPADDIPDHKFFQDACLHLLYRADDQNELFGTLNPHVNYLSYHLLDYLVDEFDLKIKDEMEKYKEDLQKFREKTPLKLYCKTQKKRYIKLSSEFREVVAVFEWPDDVTLEVVEQFRQEYACHYSLRECAMMVAEIRPCSFIVTWYVPESVAEKLKTRIPKEILQKCSATKLVVDGSCVYEEDEYYSQEPEVYHVGSAEDDEVEDDATHRRRQGVDSGFTVTPQQSSGPLMEKLPVTVMATGTSVETVAAQTHSKSTKTSTIILRCSDLLYDIDQRLKDKAYCSDHGFQIVLR
ncbi:hypothetical protein GBAR_LOCUS25095 [Geodia barretti]|uniref:Uncharacterized protein n=1 Tax=Geodia barretti TaxID=519541 RepID=A0AA35XAI2_GEOBA|nr:hypothetical protein GBAR_LOCUS25095 [Geodia barretti]